MKMESLNLVNTIHTTVTPDIEYKQKYYYSKYKYRAKIYVNGANFLFYGVRTANHWVNLINGNISNWWSTRLTDADKIEILKNKPIIEKFLDFKNNSIKDEVAIRIDTNRISIFSNDLPMLLEITKWGVTLELTECKIYGQPDVMYFAKEPKNKFRIYLKSKKVTFDRINELNNFFNTNTSLHPCGSLKKWLRLDGVKLRNSKYCSASYYIDYDEEYMLSYLAIFCEEILGTKYKLQKR